MRSSRKGLDTGGRRKERFGFPGGYSTTIRGRKKKKIGKQGEALQADLIS